MASRTSVLLLLLAATALGAATGRVSGAHGGEGSQPVAGHAHRRCRSAGAHQARLRRAACQCGCVSPRVAAACRTCSRPTAD